MMAAELMTCPRCDGLGEVLAVDDEPHELTGGCFELCPVCRGLGLVPAEWQPWGVDHG